MSKPPKRFARFLRAARLLFLLGRVGLLVIFVAGLWLRLSYRDSWDYPWATFHYLTPYSLLAGLALPEFVLQIVARRRVGILILSACVLIPAALWLHSGLRFRSAPPVEGEDAIRTVFWNADHFDFQGIPEAAEKLREFDADLLFLTEGIVDYGTQKRVFPAIFPDHEMLFLAEGRLALLKNGKILRRHYSFVGEHRQGTLLQLLIECKGRRFVLGIFDHRSDIDLSRRLALHKLVPVIDHYAGLNIPFLLLGDFNTPADSVHLEAVRSRMTNAFDVAGTGFRGTWPMPLPVLALDQVWTSEGVTPLRCVHRNLGWSRHQAVVVDVAVTSEMDPAHLGFPARYVTPAIPPRRYHHRAGAWQKRWQR